MSNAITPAQEAAAMWGSAENTAYSTRSRLVYALKALEFYGDAVERVEALISDAETVDAACIPLSKIRRAFEDQP